MESNPCESSCNCKKQTKVDMEENIGILHHQTSSSKQQPDWVNPLEKIEELLTCAICLDRYKHPKVLPCQHSFCLEPCLDGLIDVIRRTVKCPECRIEHLVPPDGARGFPTNYTLVGFLEIHLQATEQSTSELEAYIRSYNMERCKICDEKAALRLCSHCNKKICQECQNNHVEMMKRDLNRLMNQVKRVAGRITDWTDCIIRATENLNLQADSLKEEIRECLRRLYKEVKKREEVLLAEVDTYCSIEKRILKSVQEAFDFESNNINEAVARVESYQKGERNMTLDVLVRYKQMFFDGLEHLRSFTPDVDALCNKRLRFAVNTSTATLASMIAHFGEIQVCHFMTNISLQNSDIMVPRFLRVDLESDELNFEKRERSTALRHHEEQPLEGKKTSMLTEESNKTGRKANRLSTYKPSEVYESHRQSERVHVDICEAFASSPWQFGIHEPDPDQPTCSNVAYVDYKRPKIRTQSSDDPDDELNTRVANIRRDFESRRRQLDQQIHTIVHQGNSVKSSQPTSIVDDRINELNTDEEMDIQQIPIQVFTSTIASCSWPAVVVVDDEADSSPEEILDDHHQNVASADNNNAASTSLSLFNDDDERKAKRRSFVSDDKSDNKRDLNESNRRWSNKIPPTTSMKQAPFSCDKIPVKRYTYTNNAPKNNYARKGRMIVKFGEKGDSLGQFNWPRGIALSSNGREVIVCDSSNHRLQVFDLHGHFLRSYGKYGNGSGEFDSPAGVAVNHCNQLIVSDRYNHRLQILDPNGRSVRILGCHGQNNGRFNNPWGLTIGSHGIIYVCDRDNHRVQVLQSDGSFYAKFGELGSREGQFQHPHFIVANHHDQLIVSDTSNHRIQVFDQNGQFQFAFGSEGHHEGQFKYPKGVAIDDQEFIFVADSGNSRVQIFYPDGRFFAQFGSWGNGDGELRSLEDLKVTSDGFIIVTDRENHRVQIF
ncbi:RING finger protein nhl-1 [Trichinella sp. T9]|uniref:RING finger protein nhl-1 n=1 Tax=Trichinella murrelli TaxID=144512 RepID=A0A0V0TN12_9BILA|nr:RING finger protein nhl-1 [Trichinella murrelli]KRX52438.1 RING finger protein nhl-1 [Trichinella sp. T9]KRX52439.1 RING finger protein nhl-1 [Trichinella sp. T9]